MLFFLEKLVVDYEQLINIVFKYFWGMSKLMEVTGEAAKLKLL